MNNLKQYQTLIGYRKMAGLNQRDMKDILGISLTVYNAKENGKVRFNQDDMKKIKNVLSEKLNKKLTIDELFF